MSPDILILLKDIIINIIAGFIGAGIILWFVERRRIPVINFEIEPPQKIWRNAIHLRLFVQNEPMSRILSLIYKGEVAQMCKASISFHHHHDGYRVFTGDLTGRWAETPEPKFEKVQMNEQERWILSNPYELQNWVDIAPSEKNILDVVVKFDNENECYGWSNNSYFHNSRDPEWKLPEGRYIINVTVKTGGKAFRRMFHLFNMGDFRIEEVTDNSLIKLVKENGEKAQMRAHYNLDQLSGNIGSLGEKEEEIMCRAAVT